MCEPRFNLYALNTTTCCATPALMVNGPARAALGIECGYSCLGHNGRANASIGRALRLVMRNVGGSVPGAVTKSVFGQPGRVSLCFGEWEERSPWEPFHVRRGFAAGASTVTAVCATGTQDIADIFADTRRGAGLGPRPLDRLDRQQQGPGGAGQGRHAAPPVPRLRPQDRPRRHRVPDVQRMLLEWTRTPIERWHRSHWPKLEHRGYVEATCGPAAARPEQFLIAVAGGESGHHALNFCTFGLTWSVTRSFGPTPTTRAANPAISPSHQLPSEKGRRVRHPHDGHRDCRFVARPCAPTPTAA